MKWSDNRILKQQKGKRQQLNKEGNSCQERDNFKLDSFATTNKIALGMCGHV
jgi:hypothetical protein